MSEHQQITMKVASIIGRLFRAAWLSGYYPTLGAPADIQADLLILQGQQLTLLESDEPELTYLFKHIVTQQVAYESMATTTRATLHEQLAHYLETKLGPERIGIDLLAYHYTRSANLSQKKRYLKQAADAAQAQYANEAAIDYYQQLLPLQAEDEQVQTQLSLGQVLELVGRWREAETCYREAYKIAEQIENKDKNKNQNQEAIGRCQRAVGTILAKQGNYADVLSWLEQAQNSFEALAEPGQVTQTMVDIAHFLRQQGKYGQAKRYLEKSQALAEQLGDKKRMALTFDALARLAYEQGTYRDARMLHEKSLALREEMGDKQGVAISIRDLGIVATDQGDYDAAYHAYQKSLALFQEIGHKSGIARCMTSLGVTAYQRATYQDAHLYHQKALTLQREMGNKRGVGVSKINLGILARKQGDNATARHLYQDALTIFKEMENKRAIAVCLNNLGILAYTEGDYASADELYKESLALAWELDSKWVIAHTLVWLAGIAFEKLADLVRVVRLAAAIQRLTKQIDIVLDPVEGALCERLVADTRTTLSKETFTAAWAEGQAMTLEDTIGIALQE